MNFKQYLKNIGIKSGQSVIVHSSFRKIKSSFVSISPENVISNLNEIITENGSIIFPTFTYCFKKSSGDYEVFDRLNSKSKVGLLSETFRTCEGVIRTSSPTHSFALWGNVKSEMSETNSPESPLGEGSILDWLTKQPNSYVLMLGTDFSSLTFGHYLEIISKVPWFDFSPWDYMNVLPIGVSIDGEQKLKEIPGCAKSFVNFEKYLLEKELIKRYDYKSLSSYLIDIGMLLNEGIKYFSNHYEKLLCPASACLACNSRRERFL